MPELPEVETVRRVIESALGGKKIVEAEVMEDSIVLKGGPSEAVREAVLGRTLKEVRRKGKYFWLDFGESPVVLAHLGMAGWVREIGAHTIRLREHGKVSMDQPDGRPKFLKMLLTAEDGRQIAMTDGRRLARIWLKPTPAEDTAVAKLGPDCFNELPDSDWFGRQIQHRSAPIKAILLDQSVFCGVGNWIADEVLFHARIRPSRIGKELSGTEIEALRAALVNVLAKAVEVGADSEKFPSEWLFHARWGGAKGNLTIEGHELIREQIGGRTTAWAPGLQK